MTETTRARLVGLLWSGRTAAGTVVPEMILNGTAGRHHDWPSWCLEVLLATEEHEDDLKTTDVVYRACGNCLEPMGMKALVFGHRCAGAPDLPRWARAVLGAVMTLALAAFLGAGCAARAAAPQVETVGTLAAGPSTWTAPVHATTDFGHAQIVDSGDDDRTATATTETPAELPEVAPKTDGVTTGAVR